MEVKNSSKLKFSKLYARGRETGSWDSIKTSRSLRLQSMAEIFLTLITKRLSDAG
jgi:hypothetical protein